MTMPRESDPVLRRARRSGGVLLVALLALGAATALAPPDSRAVLVEQLLAVVNGKAITLTDFRRYQLLFTPDAPPDQVLQEMIDHQLLLAEADRFVTVPPPAAQVQETIRRLVHKAGGQAAWEAELRRVQLTPDGAEALISEKLRVDALLAQRVDQFVIVTRTEIEAAYDQHPERYQGKSLSEVQDSIERDLTMQKITAKRREYLGRLRSRATITVLTDTPGTLPTSP
jgi:hypothetical protein